MRASPWLLVLLAIGAAVAVWLGASELAPPARALTVALVALLPVLLLGQARMTEEQVASLPIVSAYISSMVFIWILAIGATGIGLESGMSLADLGIAPVGLVEGVAWTGALTLAALGILAGARLAGTRETPMLNRLLPRTPRERGLFVLLSLTAGVGEELAYRSFLQPALTAATGSAVLALVVGSLAFGMLHSYQHTAGVLRAALLGALLGTSLIVTGSIFPAMAAHALIDLIAGLLLADWLTAGAGSSRARDEEH